MVDERRAPTFSLPGVVDGEYERLSLDAWIGDSIVVVAFYPSNFGPQVSHSASLLRGVQALTARDDVVGVGIAPESVPSQRQFARASALDLPLASDMDGSVAAEWGVARTHESGQRYPEPAVFLVDYRGAIVAEWRSDDEPAGPDFDELRARLRQITPTRSARANYSVGYATYREGRRRLTSGLEHCDNERWSLAKTAFAAACEEFEDATDAFTRGQRLAVVARVEDRTALGRRRATKLWEAAEWLAGFATAAGKGNMGARQRHREAAERALQAADEMAPLTPVTGDAGDSRAVTASAKETASRP